MKKIYDLLGKQIKRGDVLLQLSCGGGWNINGKPATPITLYECPYIPEFDGHGFIYNILGEKSKMSWVDLSKSLIIDFSIFPKEFKYSFYHGMWRFASTENSGSVENIINSSNWREAIITKEAVAKFKKAYDKEKQYYEKSN